MAALLDDQGKPLLRPLPTLDAAPESTTVKKASSEPRPAPVEPPPPSYRKWDEIEQDDEFKALPSREQEAARQEYFTTVVTPQLGHDEIQDARKEFDRLTRSSTLGRVAHDAKRTLDVAADVAGPVIDQGLSAIGRGVKQAGETLANPPPVQRLSPPAKMAQQGVSGAGLYDPFIEEAAKTYQVPAADLRAMLNVESSGNPNATSAKGAQGLMQLMPGTAAEMGVTDSSDPRQNILGGARYYRKMLDHYKGNRELAIAAYNAGPGTVDKAGGVPNITETRNHVAKVMGRAAADQGASTDMASGHFPGDAHDHTGELMPFLQDGKNAAHVRGLNSAFQGRLAAMLKDAPAGVQIMSGYRSPERQTQLWQAALAKYGSPEAARKWVAPPGHSNHNHGIASDLTFANDQAKQWVHENAKKYGLNFRMAHEGWHIEPIEAHGDDADWAKRVGVQRDPMAQDMPKELYGLALKPGYVDTVRAKYDAASPAERAAMISGNDVESRVARFVDDGYRKATAVTDLNSELAGFGTRREDRANSYLSQGFDRKTANELANEDLLLGRDTQRLQEPERPSLLDQVKTDWQRGVLNTQAMGAGLGAWALDVTGNEEKASELLRDYQDLTQEAAQYAPVIGDFDKIGEQGLARVPEDVARYMTEAIAGNLPNFLPSLAFGGVGGMAARQATQGLVNNLIEKLGATKAAEFVAAKSAQAAQGFGRIGATAEAIKAKGAAELAQQGVTAALKNQATKTAMGAAAGAGAASVGMETGSIYGDIYDQTGQMRPGVAGAAGLAAGALDAIPAMRAATKLVDPAVTEAVAGTVMSRLGKEAGIQFLSESGTEFMQTLVENGAVHVVEGKPLVNEQDVHEALNAALQGGLAGSTTGVATQGLSEVRGAMEREPSKAAQLGAALQSQVDRARKGINDDAVARDRLDPNRAGQPNQSPAAMAARGVTSPPEPIQSRELPAWSAQLPQESGREQAQPVGPGPTGASGSTDRADGGADLLSFAPDYRGQEGGRGEPAAGANDGDASAEGLRGTQPSESEPAGNAGGLSERESGSGGTTRAVKGDIAAGDIDAADVALSQNESEKETGANAWENLSALERENWAAKAGWGTKKGAANAFGKKLAQKPWADIKPEYQAKLAKAMAGANARPAVSIASGGGAADEPAVSIASGGGAADEPAGSGERAEAVPISSGSPAKETVPGETGPATPQAGPDREGESGSGALNWVEHTTGRGKTIRGIVRKDITVQEAKQIDPHTFRKDGGFFIREKYLQPDHFPDARKMVEEAPDGSAPATAKDSLTVGATPEESSAVDNNSLSSEMPATPEATPVIPGAEPITPEADAMPSEASETADPAEALAKQAQAVAKGFNPSPGVKGTRAQMRENFIRQYAKDQPEAARAVAQAWQADPDKYAEASGATPDQIRLFARVVNEVAPAVDAKAEASPSGGFVLAPDGTPKFGKITPEIGQTIRREAGEIRLTHGNKKEGLAHIEHRHGEEIRQAGFASAPDFVYGITSAFDEIRKGEAGALLLVKKTDGKLAHNVYVRLKPSSAGVFYVVETGFVRTSAALEKLELLWPRREDRGTDTGNQPSFADTPASTAGAEAASAKSQSSLRENLGQSIGESKPQKRRVSQKAKQTDTAKAERIDDFGEKLEGACKDYASKMQAARDVDIATESLAKSWPEPDYQKMLDNGINPWSVAFLRALRDEIPTKPKNAWKLKGWVDKVQQLRDYAMNIEQADADAIQQLQHEVNIARLFTNIGGRIELYEAVGHSQSLKGVTFKKHDYMLYKGEKNVSKWSIEMPAKATAFSNWPREWVVADTKQEALDQFKEKFASLALGGKRSGLASFIIYRKRNQTGAFIGKKIGREYVDLHHANDVAAAREYMAANQAALEAKLKAYKDTPYERNEENAPRVGDDHRHGAPVTPQVFGETFGFRGVQFGNYVEQDRRQSDLNEAYDALMDMAAVLGIPPKAISLNGRLGLAFGARGKGGVNAAAAHYEPDTIVINLTKGGGPGSLGHEWWHALDNYFAHMGGSVGYMTTGRMVAGVREEMRQAFNRIRQAINNSGLRSRSKQLDKRRTKEYWTTEEEMSARSFESYLIAKLKDQSAANDYLANIISQKRWDEIEGQRDFGDEPSSSYPYPTADELPALRAAYDEFFKTVQTKDTDQGVAMFSRAESGQASEPPAFQPATDQADAQKLNRAMVRVFQDPSWSNAYVRADLPESLAEFAEAAEAAFGSEIIGITATDGRFDQFNGINLGGRNFINLNADVGFVNITGHELLHQLKRDRPDLYRWFAGQARGHYKNFSTYQSKLNALLSPGEKPMSLAAVEEELLGDFAGDALADPAFVERLAKADPSRFRQLLNAVIQWLKQVGDKLSGKGLGSSVYFTDVETLRNYLADALVAYGQGGPVAIRKVEKPKFSRDINPAMPENSAPGPQGDAQLGADKGNAVATRTPWENFPDAVILHSAGDVQRHPDYRAAKDGDVVAAKRLIDDVVTDQDLAKIKDAIGDVDALIVAVHAEESQGRNKIPLALAARIANELSKRLDVEIVQVKKAYRGGADGIHRLATRVEFSGPINTGDHYFLVDDTLTQGGTIADLKGFIESRGGSVIGATTLMGKQYSAKLQPTSETLEEVRNRYGQDFESWWEHEFGYGFDRLTESEAHHLARIRGADADTLRDRIIAARQAGSRGVADAANASNETNSADIISGSAGVEQTNQASDQGINNDPRRNAGAEKGEDSPRFSRRRPPETKPPEAPPPAPPAEFTGNPEDLFASIDGAITGGGGLKEHWAKAEDAFNELSGNTRRQVLGLMTVQQLVEQGSKVLPRMTDYLNEMTRMDATRGQIVHQADTIVKDWRQLDKPTLNRLAFVMHESTIAGVDGAEAFMPSIDVKAAEKRIKALYGFQSGAPGDKRITQWQQDIRDLKAQIGFEAKRRDEYGRIKAMYDSLPEAAKATYVRARDFHVEQSKRVEEALIAMIEKSDMTAGQRGKTITQLKKDFETQRVQAPYFPLARKGDYWVSVAPVIDADDVVVEPAEFHTFTTFEQQATFYEERAAEGRQVAKGKKLENLQEVQGVSAGFVADTLDVIGQLGENNPAAEDIRDQVYQLYLKTLPELSSRKHAIHRKKTKGFGADALRAFADKASHDAYAYARIKHGFDLRAVMEALGEDLKTAGSSHHQAQMSERKALLEEFRDDVLNAGMGFQAVKERAESMDLKAQEIMATAKKRRMTEGETFVIEEAKKWDQFHRWMKNWTQRGDGPNWVNRQLKDIEQRADTTRRVAEQERGSEYAYDVYNELQQAYKHLMSPSTGRMVVMLNSLGYLWHLAASPAAWITNAMQTPTITMPYVSGRFGVGPTTQAFATAFRESLRDAGKRDTGKEHRFGIREALTRDDEINAYTEALDRGLIERGRVMDLMGTAEEGASRSEAQRRWAMAMTFGFHDAERLNREVSFMASYRLARDAGQSFDEAVDYAAKVVNDTHFNYAAENRARFMRGDAARAITQFKSYGQHVTYLQWRAVSEALGQDATAEQKREARRFLLTQTAVQLAAAGLMGLPLNLWAGIAVTKGGIAAAKRHGLMGALGYTALVIGAAVGLSGDDEDDPTDWEEELKQGLKEAFGETGGEIISKGVFNALIGIDLSSRLSQRELWWRDIDADIDDRQLPFEILSQLMGAGVGTGIQILEGLRLASDGHTERGIEKMLPKAAKDVLQAGRFADEGALTMKGDPLIEDFTPWEITAKAIGFTPSRLSQRYEENSANTTREKRIEERRQKLTGDLAQSRIDGAMAQREGDEDKLAKAQALFEEALANAQRFNEKQPGFAIGGKTVGRSIQSRVRARAMAKNGIFLNRKIPGRYDYGTPAEDAE